MRTTLAIIIVAASATAASAQYNSRGNSYGGYGYGSTSSGHSVQGHSNNNGSYTQPHYRSNPNSTDLDNYSTRGNVNPYTGQVGTRPPRF